MFICAEVDPNTLDCLSWVQSTGLLPPLSVDAAMAIGGATLVVWATAYGVGILIRFLWEQAKGGGVNYDD